jgi:hypothetical protein
MCPRDLGKPVNEVIRRESVIGMNEIAPRNIDIVGIGVFLAPMSVAEHTLNSSSSCGQRSAGTNETPTVSANLEEQKHVAFENPRLSRSRTPSPENSAASFV